MEDETIFNVLCPISYCYHLRLRPILLGLAGLINSSFKISVITSFVSILPL